jgi:Arf-GAP/SH3 domain/ANK repeat/PH domain-containing protein
MGVVRRPQNPPPPAPNSSRLSNGRSTESISSMASDIDVPGSLHNPVPPPRRVSVRTFSLSATSEWDTRLI